MPFAVNTASKKPVNWPARSLIRNLTEAARWPRVHQEVAGCLGRPRAVRIRGDAGEMDAAGAVLDDDQDIEATEQHGVHVNEVDREDAVGLGGQELPPGRTRPPRCGTEPGIMQDLPHRRAGDGVAELDEFAVDTPVPPRRILRHADHELPDYGRRRRPAGTPSAGVVPFTCYQPPMPGKQRRRGHREHVAPPTTGDPPGQCRQPQPVGWLVADPADLTAQHRILVPEHQQFGILGHLTPGQHHQAAEQTAREQVDN